jgi:hypothetical protein
LEEALPAGFARNPDALAAEGRRRLQEAADRLRAADVADAIARVARGFWTGRVPALRGQLRQLLVAGDVDDRTVVRRRPHSSCAVSRHGDTVEVVLGDRTLRMPAWAEPAVRMALDLSELTPADLSDHLDEDSRATLVRRLVREGLFVVVDG